MKKCRRCGNVYKDINRFCNECGSNEALYICNNCKAVFESGFCPDCGVKAGDIGKICSNCKTTYFSSFCPECGSNEVLESEEETLSIQKDEAGSPVVYSSFSAYNGDFQYNRETGSQISQANEVTQEVSSSNLKPKNKWIAFFLCLFFGFFGAHMFYEGKFKSGLAWFFTFGFFGIGWLIYSIRYLFKSNPYYV